VPQAPVLAPHCLKKTAAAVMLAANPFCVFCKTWLVEPLNVDPCDIVFGWAKPDGLPSKEAFD
jgi:hypothetical protein